MFSFLFLCEYLMLLLRVHSFDIVVRRGKVSSLITLSSLMLKFSPLIALMLLLFVYEIFYFFSFLILFLKLSSYI